MKEEGPIATPCDDRAEVVFEGEHLNLTRRRGWEYADHRKARLAVMVVAITPEGQIILVEEFRPAVDASVLSLPAGLVGDERPEDARSAAKRELREETGCQAESFERLASGPGSAGASSEIVVFYLARNARQVSEPGPEESKLIRVHFVPLPELARWSRERENEGLLVDPKIWAGLYLATAAGVIPH